MTVAITFWTVVTLILLALSVPPALQSRSWARFFVSVFLCAAGMLFPLFIFLMSAFLVPEWKGACQLGYLDCFHAGKLALTPLVIWALASFYVFQVTAPFRKPRAWVDLGLFAGAVTSVLCFAFGLFIHIRDDVMALWMLVPFYVAVWYTALCVKSMLMSRRGFAPYGVTLLGSLPLWGLSVFWSWRRYLSLPDNPPSCFVVTAATRGHEAVVGPLSLVRTNGGCRAANSQLVNFWSFEDVWASVMPVSHRLFRRMYGYVGPRVAARINSKLAADCLYLILKPLEICALAVVCIYGWYHKRGFTHEKSNCCNSTNKAS